MKNWWDKITQNFGSSAKLIKNQCTKKKLFTKKKGYCAETNRSKDAMTNNSTITRQSYKKTFQEFRVIPSKYVYQCQKACVCQQI